MGIEFGGSAAGLAAATFQSLKKGVLDDIYVILFFLLVSLKQPADSLFCDLESHGVCSELLWKDEEKSGRGEGSGAAGCGWWAGLDIDLLLRQSLLVEE